MSYLRKYATGASGDINRPVIGTDGNYITSDAVFAAGDVLVSIDGGASASINTLPNYVDGFTMTFVFTNGELTGKRVLVTIHDQDGTAFADDSFEIETFGNASAAYPPDYSTGIVPTGAITADSFAAGAIDAAALASDAGTELATALLDMANGVESGATVRNTLRLIAAMLVGKVTGGGTGTEVFKSADISAGAVVGTKDRATITDDSSGNRSAIAVDLT